MRRLALALVLSLLALPALGQLSVLGLQNRMVQFLLAQISTEGVFVVTAQAVSEPGEGITAIEGLAIADADGVWLTADRVAFAWNAGRLLQGEIDFSRLSLQGVRVTRQPGTTVQAAGALAAADPPPFSWPRSPLTLRVAALDLSDIALAAPVLGHAIRFDATGAAQDEGTIQALTLAIARTDAVQGRIALDYRRDFVANTLGLTLQASEAPAGLVAALTGLADTVPVRARITAAGPPRDWRLDLDIAADRVIALTGQMSLAYEGPFRLDTTLSLTPGPLLSESLRTVLGDRAQLTARAEENAGGTVTITDARLTSPDLTAQATGFYNRPTGATDLSVDLTARPGLARLAPGVAFGGASFIGWVQGRPRDLTARGDLTLQSLATAPLDAADAVLTTLVTWQDDRLAFDISGQANGLRLDRLSPELIGPARLALTGDLTGDALTLSQLELTSAPLSLSGQGAVSLTTTDGAGRLDLSAPALAPLAQAYGIDAGGTVTARLDAIRAGGTTRAQIAARLTDARHPLARLDDLSLSGQIEQTTDLGFDLTAAASGVTAHRLGPDLLGPVTLTTRGRLNGHTLTLSALSLTATPGSIGLQGSADLAGGPLALDYQITAPALGPLAAAYDLTAQGGISARGNLTGTATAPQITGTAALTDAAWAGTGYGDASLDHDVTLAPTPQGRIALRSTGSPYGPVDLATRASYTAPRLQLDDLALTALGITGKGALTLDTATRLATGKLALGGPLTGLSRLGLPPLKGTVTADLALTAPKGRQDARLALRGKAIGTPQATAATLALDATATDLMGRMGLSATARADDLQAPGARLSRLDAKATVQDATGTPRVTASATAGPVTLADGSLDGASLTAKGPLKALDVTLTAAGTQARKPLSLDLAARIDARGPIRATVTRAQAQALGETLSLAQPLSVTAQGSAVSLTGLDLARKGGGGLTGALATHGNGLSGDLVLTALPAKLARSFAGVPVTSGRLDGTARFDTRRRGAGAQLRLVARDLDFDQTQGQGKLGASLGVDWDGKRATAALDITGAFGDPIRARAAAPLTPSGDALPRLDAKTGLDGALQWRGRIERFWALVPAPAHVLAGDLAVDLTFSGQPSAPRVAGSIALAQGRYENLDTGTILTDLTVGSTLTPDGGIALDMAAADGGQGRVSGTARVSPGVGGLDVGVTIARAVLVRRDDATARLSGQLALKGPLDSLALTGALTVDEAEVRLIANANPGIVDLGPIRFVGDPAPDPNPAPARTVALDLSVQAPGRLFVRGRGLDSEWQADLALKGDASAPRLTGRIEKRRGRLDLIGRAFDLTRGELVFDGGPRLDPRLGVILQNARDDFTGRIEVTGTASQPKLGFTSTPQVPSEEVLPRILFDKSRQSLSPSEAASLALGLATLMDGSGGTLDRVRGAVGLDSLALEQDAGGTPAIAVGKQVAPGVTVGARQSVAGSAAQVTVEVEVFDNITLDAEVGSDASTSVGVNWRKDF